MGHDTTQGYGWVTMISPTYFVTASHFSPTVDDQVTFYQGNSKTAIGAAHTYTVSHLYALSNTDLMLGSLNSSIDTSKIDYYPVSQACLEFKLRRLADVQLRVTRTEWGLMTFLTSGPHRVRFRAKWSSLSYKTRAAKAETKRTYNRAIREVPRL